jgi:hypothetical protein
MFTGENKRHNLFTEWKKECTHLLGKAKKNYHKQPNKVTK